MFQEWAAATRNAQSPTVARRMQQTISDDQTDDLKR